MGRRRQKREPFFGADRGIDKLEERVVFRSVQPVFTTDAVVDWLFPPDVVKHCKGAYTYVQLSDRGGVINETKDLPVMTAGFLTCNLTITCGPDRLRMLVPADGLADPDDVKFESLGIKAAMAEAVSIHLQFNKMRKVLEWVEANLTVAAARDYVPWLGGVLDPHHEFNTVDGKPYKEPARAPNPEILGYMRECGAIMGSALLCSPPTPEEDAARCNFGFSIDEGMFNSEVFWLL